MEGQVGCYAAEGLVQQQKSQLIPRAQFTEYCRVLHLMTYRAEPLKAIRGSLMTTPTLHSSLKILTGAPLETSCANFRKGHGPNFRTQTDLSNTYLVSYLLYDQIMDEGSFITDDLEFSSSSGLWLLKACWYWD